MQIMHTIVESNSDKAHNHKGNGSSHYTRFDTVLANYIADD